MTKPSEMSNVDAWQKSAWAHYKAWYGKDWKTEIDKIVVLPFPPDPVERVSDAVLQAIVDDANTGSNRWLLAMELIDRRAKDKGEKS